GVRQRIEETDEFEQLPIEDQRLVVDAQAQAKIGKRRAGWNQEVLKLVAQTHLFPVPFGCQVKNSTAFGENLNESSSIGLAHAKTVWTRLPTLNRHAEERDNSIQGTSMRLHVQREIPNVTGTVANSNAARATSLKACRAANSMAKSRNT